MNSPRARSRSFCALIVLLLAVTAFYSQNSQQFSIDESPLPAPTGYVNDYVGVIDAATKQELERKLDEFRKTSSPTTELAVAVVRTTGDRDIFDYSLAVYRGWKIGTKEGDNPGALLFVAIDDRKYYTQVSRDLEDELPDGLVGSLQRQYLVPQFKQGNYAKGISDTIDAYIRTIQERRGGAVSTTTASQTPAGRSAGPNGSGFSSLCCFALIGLIILMIILRGSRGMTQRDRSRWGGGGFGGAAGALPWIIGSILGSGGGGSGRSSSGDWGGGGWGGGGGFGGFGGGGDAGGGGAGGGW